MFTAITELKSKGIEITPEEEMGAKIAILLHDVGHGPYSHALEHTLIKGVRHEDLSILIMQHLNDAFNGQLNMAIQIFTNQYHKPFLYQLISGQLDVDRMDYLTRDSFFTGVSEGVIGYDRILKMLHVHQGELVVEEKGIYSIEKFLVARRLMYWQVYLHKTVLSAEKMLVGIIERARQVNARAASVVLNLFLNSELDKSNMQQFLGDFCQLDDYDVLSAIKSWTTHNDRILQWLCRGLLERKLLKIKFSPQPFSSNDIAVQKNKVCNAFNIPLEDAHYFVFTGEAINTTYDPLEERIQILFRNGTIKDISEVDNALIHHNLSRPMKKFYICFPVL
jgi:hypothetical protein